ncbi:MAG TPA: glycosyltransferase family 2 protein [Capsulimonadaceae bacterium]|jgi:glycosyltransferase involved in cell wall biosynthesis
MKTISVVTACYNEEENVDEIYRRVKAAIAAAGDYVYEHIFIDNRSTDNTVAILKRIAKSDSNVKIILNARNFGHVRSPTHALLEARGDAVINIVADMQDPPEMIVDFLREWEDGASVVLAVKNSSAEGRLMYAVRKRYYEFINRIATIQTFENFTGFGLYDRRVMDLIKSFRDPYPYFRGLIAEIGLPYKLLPYDQPARKRGLTKNNLYTLYDMAMLGVVNLSKVPLRVVTWIGFVSALVSILVALVYFIYKLLYWNNFSVGQAPIVIGVFFFSSVQLISLGILGEYVAAIHTQVQNRPYVVELERVNFEHPAGRPSLPE